MLVALGPALFHEMVHFESLRPPFKLNVIVADLPELERRLLQDKFREYILERDGGVVRYGYLRVDLEHAPFEEPLQRHLPEDEWRKMPK